MLQSIQANSEQYMLYTQQLIPTSVNRFTEIRANIWSQSSKDLLIWCFNVIFFNAGENRLYSKGFAIPPPPLSQSFKLLLYPSLCLSFVFAFLSLQIYLLHFLQLDLLKILIAVNISRWHYHRVIVVRGAKFFTSSGS